MSAFAETSFLCSHFRKDCHANKVDQWLGKGDPVIPISSLVAFEYRQSIRLLGFQNSRNPSIGISKDEGDILIADFFQEIRDGDISVVDVDWREVHALAEMLSAKHTHFLGNRFADVLHVATALNLNCSEFLSFDTNQRALAEAEGLAVPL